MTSMTPYSELTDKSVKEILYTLSLLTFLTAGTLSILGQGYTIPGARPLIQIHFVQWWVIVVGLQHET